MSGPAEQALLIALKALRCSDKLESELYGLLEIKGFPAHTISSTLDQIRRWGFLDDERVLQSWADSYRRRNRGGKAKLASLLIRRGLSENESESLAELLISDEDEREMAEETLRTKNPKSAPQAYRSLISKGFSESVAEDAVRGYFGEALDNDPI